MSEKHKDRKFLGVLIRTNHQATSIRSMLEGTLKSKYNACRHCSKSGGLAGSAPARSPRWLAEDSHKFRTRLWTAVRSVERRRKRAWQLLGGEKKLGPAPVCVIHIGSGARRSRERQVRGSLDLGSCEGSRSLIGCRRKMLEIATLAASAIFPGDKSRISSREKQI